MRRSLLVPARARPTSISDELNHIIVVSLLDFTGFHAGAPYGYVDWLRVVGWATIGNLVRGQGLVTTVRLVEVGQQRPAKSAKARTAPRTACEPHLELSRSRREPVI